MIFIAHSQVIAHPQTDESKDAQPLKTRVDAQSNILQDLEDKFDAADQDVLTKAANVMENTERLKGHINSHGAVSAKVDAQDRREMPQGNLYNGSSVST